MLRVTRRARVADHTAVRMCATSLLARWHDTCAAEGLLHKSASARVCTLMRSSCGAGRQSGPRWAYDPMERRLPALWARRWAGRGRCTSCDDVPLLPSAACTISSMSTVRCAMASRIGADADNLTPSCWTTVRLAPIAGGEVCRRPAQRRAGPHERAARLVAGGPAAAAAQPDAHPARAATECRGCSHVLTMARCARWSAPVRVFVVHASSDLTRMTPACACVAVPKVLQLLASHA